MSIAEKLVTAAENIPKVFDAGKKAQYDEFWDSFQNEGERTFYHTAFARGTWKNGTTYMPKYPIVCEGSNAATTMFSYSQVTDTLVPITISGKSASVFYGSAVVTINKLILGDDVAAMGDWFNNCNSLENITFEGEIPVTTKFAQSAKLTASSMVNIVEHLSSSAEDHSVAFASAAVEGANWAETEYESWDALIATKPNWTFTLS